MPVHIVECPECGHKYRALVLDGTRPPDTWSCSKCGSQTAASTALDAGQTHPLEAPHGSGCRCCGF